MKKIIVLFLLSLSLFLFTAVCAGASEKVSPALDLLTEDCSMIKSGVLYSGGIGFCAEDFDRALGLKKVSSVTVRTLPPSADGRLMLGNLYVVENQILAREDLSSLKFVPTGSEAKVSAFTFTAGENEYAISCALKVLNEINFTPTASSEVTDAWTQTNISCYGVMAASDPEGDALRFEITSYPRKGLLTVTNASGGEYKYTPYLDATGTDTFTYRVMDACGNYSAESNVKISVEKLRTSLTLADMKEKRGENEAMILVSEGIMSSVKGADGKECFLPEKTVIREEFLKMTMDAFGAKNVPTVNQTSFDDDGEITGTCKGYVEVAYRLGIITGEVKDTLLYFRPQDAITRAEAAVMINNILGAKAPDAVSAFADNDDIPAWAKSAIYALDQYDIFAKTGSNRILPNEKLNRAQTAQILYSLMDTVGKV